MNYKAPSISDLQAQCDAFNAACTIGGRVAVKIDGTDKPRITTTRSKAQILSGHSAVVWMTDVSGCYLLTHVTPIPDPAYAEAWAIYAESGNVRMWSVCREDVERLAAALGKPVFPYTPPEVPDWTATPPTEQGEYWHWSGDREAAPSVLSILWSGTAQKCFVPMNQTHSGQAEMCDAYGGYWLRLRAPRIPAELSHA